MASGAGLALSLAGHGLGGGVPDAELVLDRVADEVGLRLLARTGVLRQGGGGGVVEGGAEPREASERHAGQCPARTRAVQSINSNSRPLKSNLFQLCFWSSARCTSARGASRSHKNRQGGDTVKLVQGPELLAEIVGLCATSKRARMAVAFWGDGAADALGLDKGAAGVSIVCNLRMGGTNPGEIRKLIELGVVVKHSDTLHAKIYLFDEVGAVGSSNASANGLSLQGHEVGGWLEANVMFGPGVIYEQASAMFEDILSTAKDVTEPDLAKAQAAWDRRRRAGTGTVRPGVKNFLDVLRNQPELLSGRQVFITLDFHDMSKAADKVVAQVQKETGLSEVLSAWEGWPEMPNGADFICFGSRDGIIEFEGLWHSEAERFEVKVGRKGHVCFVHRSSQIQNFDKLGSKTEWRKILRRIVKQKGKEYIICIEAGEFARDYLVEPSQVSS